MSYSTAIGRVNELREKFGMEPRNVRTIGATNFDQVLATAQNRFNQGPARIVTPSSTIAQGDWGTPSNVGTTTRSAPRAPMAGAAQPPFATPARVNGWSDQLRTMVHSAADQHGVPRALVTAVARAESAFRSDVVSPAGATGLMQLMPATARGLGVSDARDPWQNLVGGTKYLRQLMDRFDNDWTKVIAGYNAGPNAVAKHGGVPPYAETQTYVARVLDYAAELGWRP